ncbi:hypothetical protein ACI3KS_08795 [Microbacterium sp. ZW T5_45]|uniref:hypothetical protein n=1 Tax=Microbacterium sp. ZW T5_45 TaxID=3378080 RepID=UPI0038534B3F
MPNIDVNTNAVKSDPFWSVLRRRHTDIDIIVDPDETRAPTTDVRGRSDTGLDP